MSTKFVKDLVNIEALDISNACKLRVCAEYLLPSLRFDLTVNDICESHLKQINKILDIHLKC